MTVLAGAKAINYLVAGVLVGVLAFWVTAWQPDRMYLGPLGVGRVLEAPGFDPWTGLGHGRTYELIDITGSGLIEPGELVHEPGFRTWFGTRHALPVPIGVAAAWIAIVFVIAARRRRRQTVVGEVGVEPTRRSRGTGS